MPFCSSCGKPLDTRAQYCPSCGAKVTQTGVSLPPMPGGDYWLNDFGERASFGQHDSYALGKIKLFSLLTLILSVSGFVVYLDLYLTLPFPLFFFTGSNLEPFLLLIGVLGGVQLFLLYELRLGLSKLSTVDKWRFSTPSQLLILAMIGLLIIFAGFYLAVVQSAALFQTVGTNQPPINQTNFPSSQFISSVSAIFAGVLLAFVGGIIALIGIIGGEILGLWRLGSRYDQNTIKAGAILLVIPYLALISPILLYIGAYRASKKVRGS